MNSKPASRIHSSFNCDFCEAWLRNVSVMGQISCPNGWVIGRPRYVLQRLSIPTTKAFHLAQVNHLSVLHAFKLPQVKNILWVFEFSRLKLWVPAYVPKLYIKEVNSILFRFNWVCTALIEPDRPNLAIERKVWCKVTHFTIDATVSDYNFFLKCERSFDIIFHSANFVGNRTPHDCRRPSRGKRSITIAIDVVQLITYRRHWRNLIKLAVVPYIQENDKLFRVCRIHVCSRNASYYRDLIDTDVSWVICLHWEGQVARIYDDPGGKWLVGTIDHVF